MPLPQHGLTFPASARLAVLAAPRCSLLSLQGETCFQTPAVCRHTAELSSVCQKASSGCDLDPAVRCWWMEPAWGSPIAAISTIFCAVTNLPRASQFLKKIKGGQ